MEPSATTIARTLVDELVAQGVTDVVIAPGSRSAPLSLAAAARPELRLHVRIDERTAAFLALGLGRGSGRPAVVLCSSGTATANFHPAVLEADAAGVPLLVLTADRPAELRDVGANQTTRQADLYGDATRWSHVVDGTSGADPGRYLRSLVVRAVSEAVGPTATAVPGPVHLNVPLREPLTDPAGGGTALPGHGARVWPATDPVRGAGGGVTAPTATALPTVAGRRGLVVAGEGAVPSGPLGSAPAGPGPQDRGLVAQVLHAARALGWPVLAEPTSGLRTGAPALRTGHWLAAAPAFVRAHLPEVVVVLGRPVLSRPVAALVEATAAAGGRVVVCDPHRRFHDPGRNATDLLAAPFTAAGNDLVAAALADPRPVPGWLEAWTRADAVAGEVLDGLLGQAGPPSEMGTARDVAATMPDGSALVVGSSLAIRHLNEAMAPRDGVRVVGNRGLSGIDGFVSTALGVALAHDGPTAALTGDLSVVHDVTGLVLGPDEPRVPLPIVVLSNDGGGIFDLLPYGSQVEAATFRRLFLTPHGVPLEGLAISAGCGHTVVDTLEELPRVLHDAWGSPGITLVEVPTDTPTETARHREVQAAVADALSSTTLS